MKLSPFDLSGKVAIVTGANTGIGQGIAIALAEAGADIAAVGRTAPAETEAKVKAAGGRFVHISADLGSHEAHRRASFPPTLKALGRADILVNNAGTIRRADAVDFTEEDWDAVMDVNLKSVFFLRRRSRSTPSRASRKRKIIQIASCSPSRAASACRAIRPQKRAWRASPS